MDATRTNCRNRRLDSGKSDLVAVQGKERKGHKRGALVEGLGGSADGGRRVRRAVVLLQGVHRTGEVREGERHRDILVVRVDQGPVGVPATAVGHRILHDHVDLVPDAQPAVHRGLDEGIRRERHPEHRAGELAAGSP